jgi:hypothetical protein
MTIANSNVQIKVNPLVNANLVHFIASQVTYNGGGSNSYSIQYNNQNDGNSMGTQGGQLISTQGI